MTGPAAAAAALDGSHVLAVPRSTALLPLARAWFPAASWAREPSVPVEVRPATGARFRGIAVAPPDAAGALSLGGPVEVVGPYPLDAADARALGLPPRDTDLYGLPAGPVDASVPSDLVWSWATAVARRTDGGIVTAARDRVLVPDPASAVDLTLWAPAPLSADAAVPAVRPALAGSRLAVPAHRATTEGFALVAAYEFDGDVEVTCTRADEVPVVLDSVDPAGHGPWAYEVVWHPPDPAELERAQPSRLHVIARQRVAPGIARVVASLQRAVGGTVVDAGGFVVPPAELEVRARVR